jgi:hypothetical protein
MWRSIQELPEHSAATHIKFDVNRTAFEPRSVCSYLFLLHFLASSDLAQSPASCLVATLSRFETFVSAIQRTSDASALFVVVPRRFFSDFICNPIETVTQPGDSLSERERLAFGIRFIPITSRGEKT